MNAIENWAAQYAQQLKEKMTDEGIFSLAEIEIILETARTAFIHGSQITFELINEFLGQYRQTFKEDGQ